MCAPKRYVEIGFDGWLGCTNAAVKETYRDDPDEWCLSRLDELCRGEKFEQSCDAESEGAC